MTFVATYLQIANIHRLFEKYQVAIDGLVIFLGYPGRASLFNLDVRGLTGLIPGPFPILPWRPHMYTPSEVIDFHQTLEVNGIRFWCYTAGHVLGAAMFMVDIAGVRVLYTGDYSREEDRHLRAAELPQFSPETTFKGRVFMTHATKAIYKLLLSDYVKVSKVSVEDMLFDEQDILRSMDKIE
nr:cleavage and polyadenylation specificity factor subunit 3 [Tanacetum cinerariifolium]